MRLKCFVPLIALALGAGCTSVAPRAHFLRLIDRPRVGLASQIEESVTTNGFIQSHFSFAADTQNRVPGIMVKAADAPGRHPVVIVLHGTGGSKASVSALCEKFATNGFIAVAIDGRYHGERA